MIYLELSALFLIVILQVRYFNRSLTEIKELKGLFPTIPLTEEHVCIDESTGSEQIIVDEHRNASFHNILRATNQYLKRNKGSADYNIIKDIADRTTDAQEEKIASEISVPLYLGLMGTFAGVILGLLSLVIDGGFDMTTNKNDERVQGLLTGVIVAMVVSLLGLILTTFNNSINFKKAITFRNISRNDYYNFLQTELLPHLGNNIFNALDQLKVNISDFNVKFAKNLDLFDGSFNDNIKHLKETVGGMTLQIGVVNENTKVQLEFLHELRKIGYNRMAEANIKVLDKLKETGPILIQFIKEQQNLNKNMEVANQLASNINQLFDRVNTFENSINDLGRDIQQSDMLGAEVINVVRKHLNVIDERERLINDYAARTNNEVEQYLSNNYERILELKRKIESDFQRAFDFDSEGNVLQNLLHLASINDNILGLKSTVDLLHGIDEIKPKLDLILVELRSKHDNDNNELKDVNNGSEVMETVDEVTRENANKQSWWVKLAKGRD